jgi:sugar phosphate isomerase/epimerase
MSYKRRDFIKLGVQSAAALALVQMGCNSAAKAAGSGKHIEQFGLQLYTLRDDMPKDPKAILKQIAGFGYKQIESYEGGNGMFWGMGHKGFKQYMDELGMRIVSSHCDMNKDFERKAAEAAEIGMKYLVCPYIGKQKSLDDYKRYADTFNQKGEICRKNGIRFAYHNHAYSFEKQDGQYPQQLMMDMTNKDTVDYEMDIYWVVAAGEDVGNWLSKYKNRFRLCHIKDRAKNAVGGDASVNIGTGSIDFSKVLKSAIDNGMQYFIVEQEKYEGTTPLEAVKANAAYMKLLKV